MAPESQIGCALICESSMASAFRRKTAVGTENWGWPMTGDDYFGVDVVCGWWRGTYRQAGMGDNVLQP